MTILHTTAQDQRVTKRSLAVVFVLSILIWVGSLAVLALFLSFCNRIFFGT